MEVPFISIVIPVYNAAEYLPACLDSLLAQSFTDWEAICVNDGSKDGSLTILQQYAAKDARIRVIDKPNGGVSTARNAALDAACGQYLYRVASQGDFHVGGFTHLYHRNFVCVAPPECNLTRSALLLGINGLEYFLNFSDDMEREQERRFNELHQQAIRKWIPA